MMSAILDENDSINLQISIAQVDDLDEIHADINTGKAFPTISNSKLHVSQQLAYHLQETNLKLHVFQWQHVENQDFPNTQH
jgi:hypothetical protein